MSRLFLCLVLCTFFPARAEFQTISTNRYHLGIPGNPEWDTFAGDAPFADKLEFAFSAKRNAHESTLLIHQDDVKQEWTVTLNGKKLGQLFLMEADLWHALPIPSGLLRDGTNSLQISAKAADDIVINEITLADVAPQRLLSSNLLEVTIRDLKTHEAIPSRITVLDSRGVLAALTDFGSSQTAARPGVVYTANGSARIGLMAGSYTLFATRGPEYSVAKRQVTIEGSRTRAELAIERVIDTRGWVACDTHVHTLSLSKHGDALLRERMITIAGEGIELAVSTEHNQHADYQPAARELGLQHQFTILPGNEVTTAKGHFNIFPVDLSGAPANAKLESWPQLFSSMRGTPNVQVVILNHPTDTHSGFTPFASTNLNLVTGRNLRGDFPFTFDAMELINSGAMRSDWMEPFQAWFALLNRGYRITGVGASDSHDVSRFIVGQGRTYLAISDAEPGRIDLQRACDALKAGHAVVSLGLFPSISVSSGGEKFGPGDLCRASGPIEIAVRAEWPDWMIATNTAIESAIRLFANGREIQAWKGEPGWNVLAFTAKLAQPKLDTYYTIIATAPGTTAPFWGLARPYQPTSTHWDPLLIGATNPVWVDADGDGHFTAPAEYAKRLFERFGSSTEKLLAEAARYDAATVTQLAELLDLNGISLRSPKFENQLQHSTEQVQAAFSAYLKSL